MYATLEIVGRGVVAQAEVAGAGDAVTLWYNRYRDSQPGLYTISLWPSKRRAFEMQPASVAFAVGPTPDGDVLAEYTAMVAV